MAAPPRPWTVLHPGPLESIDDDLWAIEDDVPGIPGLQRRMVIVRRSDGGLLFYNAVPVPDATLDAIRRLGDPRHLVLPNRFHALDAAAFRDKLGVDVFAPAPTIESTRTSVPCAPLEELPADPALTVHIVDGFKTGEAELMVRRGARASLVVGDLVLHQQHGRGFYGFMFRVLGFSGPEPKLPYPVRMRVLRDKAAVRALLERLAATDGLARIVLSHGPIVSADPAAVLRRIAASL